MNQHCASEVAGLIRQYAHSPPDTSYSIERDIIDRPLEGFKSAADDRPCEGAFLVRRADGLARWLLVIDWRGKREYYVVVLSDNKSLILAELREVGESGKERTLHWDYRPSRRKDDRNVERKCYFERYFGDTHAAVSIPQEVDQVADFISDLFDLAECRAKADELDDQDEPDYRSAFNEGRFRERLHRERERNSEVTRRAKAEALLKHGKLQCQCCDFDFKSVYGLVGEGYIEAHHVKPVSDLYEDGEETRIEDIALVCSNCHSMLHRKHRKRPWLGMTDLKNLIT